MWPLGVVLDAPALDDLSGLVHRDEPMLVQALVPELAVERFDVGVLHGLARANEGEHDVICVGPGIQHLAFELRAMINSDRLGQPADIGQAFEHRDDTRAGNRGVDLQGQAFAGAVIDDRETAQASTIGQAVGDEVHRPARIGMQRLR